MTTSTMTTGDILRKAAGRVREGCGEGAGLEGCRAGLGW